MAPIKLSDALIGELRTNQRTLHDLIAELDKAESCGVDCQEFRRVHQQEHERITALIQHYSK